MALAPYLFLSLKLNWNPSMHIELRTMLELRIFGRSHKYTNLEIFTVWSFMDKY